MEKSTSLPPLQEEEDVTETAGGRHACPAEGLPRDSKDNPPDCSDHDIALWFTVVAHALQAIDLGQVMDDAAVVSVHGGEAVAFLIALSLIGRREHRLALSPGNGKCS